MAHSPRLRRFLGLSTRFLTVGALSTLIEIVAFNLLFYAFSLDGVFTKVIASLIALVNAYFGNRQWTFKGRGKHGRALELLLFFSVNGVCTLLGTLIVWAGLVLFPTADPIVINLINLISIGVVVIVRFALYHFVVFPGFRAPARHSESDDSRR